MKTYTLTLAEAMMLLHILRCHWEVKNDNPDELSIVIECIYTILSGPFNENYVAYEANRQQAFAIWLYADTYVKFCKTQDDEEELKNAEALREKLRGDAGV